MHYLYARVSTVEQAADGAASIPEQLRKCRALATMRGVSAIDCVEHVDKGVSGSIPLGARPDGSTMLQSCRQGDVIVSCKLDRLFRSATDALVTVENLTKIGVQLIVIDLGIEPVTSNGTAKLFFGILSLMAEFERDRIRERTEEGRRAKRVRRGFMGGGVPFGFRVVGAGRDAKVEENEIEQKTIEVILKMMENGHKPSRIARYLTVHYPTRSGKPWQQVQVERILNKLEAA